jgi:2-polyprenyl-3-methyl-5-hydroxy-6-metoxy-1,4-benzoquinol methylase
LIGTRSNRTVYMPVNVEDGIVIGNIEQKYDPKNFIVRKLMDGFFSAFDGLMERTDASSVYEAGCGEGHLSRHIADRGVSVKASDFSSKVIETARALNTGYNINFEVKSVYDLQSENDPVDLVVCCEVLEHIDEPERGLRALQKLTSSWCIVSVPREPVWRILNMARGKYIGDMGNTPGHLNHWSSKSFILLVGQYFEVVEIRKPLPWTMLLCRSFASK